MPRRTVFAVVLAFGLVLAGCGDADEPAADAGDEVLEPSPTDAPDDDPGAPEDEGGTPDGDEESPMPQDGDREQLAIRDAADRVGVGVDEVAVVTHEQVTWPDGALGCPQPDQFYTQALIEGYRIVVEAGGQTLHYHGRAGGAPTYCEDPEEPASGASGGTVDR